MDGKTIFKNPEYNSFFNGLSCKWIEVVWQLVE